MPNTSQVRIEQSSLKTIWITRIISGSLISIVNGVLHTHPPSPFHKKKQENWKCLMNRSGDGGNSPKSALSSTEIPLKS